MAIEISVTLTCRRMCNETMTYDVFLYDNDYRSLEAQVYRGMLESQWSIGLQSDWVYCPKHTIEEINRKES